MCQLLNNKVHHLSKGGILVLEELRNTKEEGRSFVCRKSLSGVHQQSKLRKEDTASPWLNWGGVKESCCAMLDGALSIGGKGQMLTLLEDRGAVDAHNALVGILIFLGIAHVGGEVSSSANMKYSQDKCLA